MQKGGEVSNRTILSYFFQSAKRYPWSLLFTIIFSALLFAGDIVVPWFMKDFVDTISMGARTDAAVQKLSGIVLAIIGIKAVVFTAMRLRFFAWNWFESKVMADLETSAFSKLLGHSYQFFADNFTGSLVKKVSRFAQAFEGVADVIMLEFFPVAAFTVGVGVSIAYRFPNLLPWFIAWVVVFFSVTALAYSLKRPYDIKSSELDSQVGGAVSDAVTNSINIKLFTGNAFENARFEKVVRAWTSLLCFRWNLNEVIVAVQSFFMMAAEIAFLTYAVNGWKNGVLTAGDIILLQSLFATLVSRLWNFSGLLRRWLESLASAAEMVKILELPYEVKDLRGAKELRVRHGKIEFRSVEFRFRKKSPILEDFSLSIGAGEKIALVGPSGAGKTTITKLLFRFYDINRGSIRIDGQDIGSVTQESLRANISLVPQEPVLFHRSLFENIQYGRRSATREEVIAAAKQAHCHEFIMTQKEGYETLVGERGIKLSGGERQRIAIARAILKDAPILVLDEATASLDSESEKLIQDALQTLMRGKTVIVIAHRLSTIMQMDRIIVLEGGKITSMGTHDELKEQEGRYQKLWNIQAGGFREARTT